MITIYDLTNPRSPQIVANVTTPYVPGPAIGRAAVVIGPHRFLFGGVLYAVGNNNFIIVDTTTLSNTAVTLSETSTSINYAQVVGTQLYAGSATGLQIYSITGSIAPAIASNGVENGGSPLLFRWRPCGTLR